jgi:branched-chain amino acid transport system substrate-binding protein
LEKAGAKRVFVAGDSADIGIMIRDAAAQKYDAIFAGGETLGEQPVTGLARGTLTIGLPQWRSIANKDSLARLAAAGVMPDGYVLPSYAAAEIAVRAAGQPKVLESSEFRTAIGSIGFDAKGDLAVSPYRLFEYDGQSFVTVESE